VLEKEKNYSFLNNTRVLSFSLFGKEHNFGISRTPPHETGKVLIAIWQTAFHWVRYWTKTNQGVSRSWSTSFHGVLRNCNLLIFFNSQEGKKWFFPFPFSSSQYLSWFFIFRLRKPAKWKGNKRTLVFMIYTHFPDFGKKWKSQLLKTYLPLKWTIHKEWYCRASAWSGIAPWNLVCELLGHTSAQNAVCLRLWNSSLFILAQKNSRIERPNPSKMETCKKLCKTISFFTQNSKAGDYFSAEKFW